MKKIMFILAVIAMMAAGCKDELQCGDWEEVSGDRCVEMREKFYGTYVGTTTISLNGSQTTLTETKLKAYPGDAQRFYIDDLKAELRSSTTFEIPLQNVYDAQLGLVSFEGNGSLNGNQLVYNTRSQVPGLTEIAYLNFTGTK